MKHRRMASDPPLCEEDFASNKFLREAAKQINFVWILAEFHRRPRARRLLDQLAQALALRLRQKANLE